MKLRIFKEEDRITVAGILIKNGYRVQQGKERTTPTGKSYSYYLEVERVQDMEKKDES